MWEHCFEELPDTLLGFETTGPCPFFVGVAPRWWGRRVVALLWWWGVVFDLWIVVASISAAGRDWPLDVCLFRGCVCGGWSWCVVLLWCDFSV